MKKIIIKNLVSYASVVCLMLISLCFSTQLEILFKLKPNLTQINSSALEVHFVDVGQGDAILIKNNNQTILIDSGDSSSENQLLTYINNVFFRDTKNKVFNYVILTHSDSDHSGNMLSILNNYTVQTFYRPQIYVSGLEYATEPAKYETSTSYMQIITKLTQLQQLGKTEVKYASMGICFNLSDAVVNILAPVKSYYSSTNEYSAVVTVEKFGSKFMFAGDATQENELEIINNNSSSLLDVDVLKIAHHGSSTSTSMQFLEATSPSLAIISVGANNSFGHPSSSVLNNISEYNLSSNTKTSVLQTASLGNIVCYVNGNLGVKHTCIKSVYDYLFVSWWHIVVLIIAVSTVGFGVPILVKWLKQAKTSKL